MRPLLLTLALLLTASRAQAYSILWGPMVHCDALAEAFSYEGGESFHYSGDQPAGLVAYSYTAFALAYAGPSAIVCEADGYLPEVGWSAAGNAEATVERAFRVIDGSGPVDVEIAGAFEGGWYGGGAAAIDWSFGVEGVSEIGASLPSIDNGAWTWSGSLNYGQTYVARAHVNAWSGELPVQADLSWDAPIDAQPIPEPSTWALLGLGLVGLALARRSVFGRSAVCTRAVFRS